MEHHPVTEQKKASSQISFRVASEIKEALEKKAAEKGITTAELYREMIEKGIGDPISSGKEDSVDINKDRSIDQTVNEVLEKVNEILGVIGAKAVDINSQEIQNQIDEGINSGIEQITPQIEEEIRSNNLLLRFNEKQRNLLLNLISFRKEKGESDSAGSIESFLLKAIKYKVMTSVFFPSVPQGFKEEFEESFKEFLSEPGIE